VFSFQEWGSFLSRPLPCAMHFGIFRTNSARSRYFLHGCSAWNSKTSAQSPTKSVPDKCTHSFLLCCSPDDGKLHFHCKCRALDVEHVYLNFAPRLQLWIPTPVCQSAAPRFGVQFRYPLGAVMHRQWMPSMMLMAIIICMPFHQYKAFHRLLSRFHSGTDRHCLWRLLIDLNR